MRTPALLVVAAVAGISCTFSPTGLGVRGGEEGADAGPSGRVAPDPAGFAARPDDAGAPLALDSAPLAADATPAMPTGLPPTEPTSTPPAPPPDAAPPALPPDAAPAAPPPTGFRLLRVHDVKVGRLIARIVHAHQLDAAGGDPGLVFPPAPDPLLKLELGTEDVEADELIVDVLYAHDIKAGWVRIDQTHARLKGKRAGGED